MVSTFMTEIFSTKIFEQKMPGYDELGRDILPVLQDLILQNGVLYNLQNLYTLNRQYFELADLPHGAEIHAFIHASIRHYWRLLGYRGSPKIKYHWANINMPGGATLMHDHAPSPIAGCFYISVPDNSGNLYLANPNEVLLRHQPYNEDQVRHHIFSFDHEVQVQSGKLVMWPGYLVHRSAKNMSYQNRVLIGFDVDFAE